MRRSPRLTRPGPIRRSWRDLNPWIHDDELCWLHTCLQGFKLLKCDTLPQNTKTVTAFRHKYFPLFSSTNLKYFLSEIIHTQENRSRGTHSAKSLISNFIKGLAYSKMMSCVDCKIVPQLSTRFWIPKLWHLVSKILWLFVTCLRDAKVQNAKRWSLRFRIPKLWHLVSKADEGDDHANRHKAKPHVEQGRDSTF